MFLLLGICDRQGQIWKIKPRHRSENTSVKNGGSSPFLNQILVTPQEYQKGVMSKAGHELVGFFKSKSLDSQQSKIETRLNQAHFLVRVPDSLEYLLLNGGTAGSDGFGGGVSRRQRGAVGS